MLAKVLISYQSNFIKELILRVPCSLIWLLANDVVIMVQRFDTDKKNQKPLKKHLTKRIFGL